MDKCKIKNCLNNSDQEVFIGKFCCPCYHFIYNNEFNNSQACLNMINEGLNLDNDTLNKIYQNIRKFIKKGEIK